MNKLTNIVKISRRVIDTATVYMRDLQFFSMKQRKRLNG
jgi:hypothetical protein